MPQITLDTSDAAELAEMLTFLASWLTGSQQQILADSFAALVGHPAYNTAITRPAAGRGMDPAHRVLRQCYRPAVTVQRHD